jgi:hypothetical protein
MLNTEFPCRYDYLETCHTIQQKKGPDPSPKAGVGNLLIREGATLTRREVVAGRIKF